MPLDRPCSKQESLDDLVEAIEARQSLAILGEAGVAKTCVTRAVRRVLPPERFRGPRTRSANAGEGRVPAPRLESP